MNLFEITEQFAALRDMEEDVEPDVFADTMEDIQCSFEEKVDAYHAILVEWAGKKDAISKEINRLRALKSTLEHREDLMNENLMICLDKLGIREYKTGLNKVRIQTR